MSLLASYTFANPNAEYYISANQEASEGVLQLVAGTNVTLAPTTGVGVVTINSAAPFVTGMIMMYNGTAAPAGWALCDGTNGTPNLTNRFIVNAGGSGSAYPLGLTGGNGTVTLTAANLPALSVTVGSNGGIGTNVGQGGTINTTELQFAVADTGANTPVYIIPPFYALTYIMKL